MLLFFKVTLLALLHMVWSQEQSELDHFFDVIETTTTDAETFELPTNAEEYRAENRPKKFGSFDFVIIGAGSAGSVMATRLSEIENLSVLVLEAGGFPNDATSVPGLFFPLQFSEFNWGFYSIPQTTACLGMVDRKCPYPRGKGLGGSTLINGMVYARGYDRDFDEWAQLVDDPTWSYENVLPYFLKSENYTHRDPTAVVEPHYHSVGGELHVEYHIPLSGQMKYWFEGNEELDYLQVDYNANRLGTSSQQYKTFNGRRWHEGVSFLLPVINRRNLKVMTRSYVTKIGINRRTKMVEKVYFSCNNTRYVVNVRMEAILSAGTFQTPQLLMLSGIGPKEHLEQFNIPVIEDLEVGSTLRDHPTFYGINFGTNYTEPNQTDKDLVRDFLNGVGVLTAHGNCHAIGFYPSRYSDGNIPDIEILVTPANQNLKVLFQRSFGFTDQTYGRIMKNANVQQTLTLFLIVLHAFSTGTVRLKSDNPYDYPLIDPRFLSDPEDHDINVMYDAVQFILELAQTESFRKINATLQSGPLEQCEQYPYMSQDYWYCAIRIATLNLYHPTSTCQMARNRNEGVVDSHGVVFGMKNLRVVDASIFPLTLAGHPNSAVVMVAEVIADLIKEQYTGGL